MQKEIRVDQEQKKEILERICEELHNENLENELLLRAFVKELIALQKNAPAGNRDITE